MNRAESPDADRHRRELLDILKRLEAAENAGDADYFAGMLTDDVVVIVPDFPVQEGREAASRFVCDITEWQREHLDRRITYTSTEILVEDGLAFDRGSFSFDVAWKSGGDTETVTGKYMYIYRRDGAGTWKIWRAMMCRDEGE